MAAGSSRNLPRLTGSDKPTRPHASLLRGRVTIWRITQSVWLRTSTSLLYRCRLRPASKARCAIVRPQSTLICKSCCYERKRIGCFVESCRRRLPNWPIYQAFPLGGFEFRGRLLSRCSSSHADDLRCEKSHARASGALNSFVAQHRVDVEVLNHPSSAALQQNDLEGRAAILKAGFCSVSR